MVLDIGRELVTHLGSDERVGNALRVEIVVEVGQVETDVFPDNMDAGAACQCRVKIHHAGVEAVAGICRHAICRGQTIESLIPMTESHQVAVFQLATLRCSRGTGGVEHDEKA